MFYSAFGLALRTNRSIPGLIPRPAVSSVDTDIWLDPASWKPAIDGLPEEVWHVSEERDGNASALRVWRLGRGDWFRLLYSDGHEFFVNRRGTEVWARWPGSSTIEDAAIYLLGPILGFVLRLRGTTCLHASAVTVGGRAIALLGPASAGKSTTAAVFARAGYPVLADDVAAVFERGAASWIQPAYPQLRLWPESVALVCGTPDALPPLTPTWDKRALDLTREGWRFDGQPRPLAAIYVLAGRESEVNRSAGIEPLRARDSLLTLVANTCVGYLLDAEMRAQEFRTLGCVVSSVAVRQIVSAGAREPLTVLRDRILQDCEALPARRISAAGARR